ncbi:hypothetical protein CGRA01v4_10296 [Colletotrichum graminicola]|nr:hypothetical protein CGRA01v4_10296 [Colletotrichum graminicola]
MRPCRLSVGLISDTNSCNPCRAQVFGMVEMPPCRRYRRRPKLCSSPSFCRHLQCSHIMCRWRRLLDIANTCGHGQDISKGLHI